MSLIIKLLLVAMVLVGCSGTKQPRIEDLVFLQNKVTTNISYKQDVGDHWQKASETLELKTGDCEDFAILYAALLMQDGVSKADLDFGYYKSTVSNKQHLVLLVSSYYGYWMVDNYGISLFRPTYRQEFEFQYGIPIISSRTPKEFYILP